LISESKVDTLLGHGDAFDFGVDVHLGVGIESSIACGYATCAEKNRLNKPFSPAKLSRYFIV